ncbi:MAG TPA: aspartyl protease family protein [Candidatus Angelobacter sp.]|nr:aspartyl protease family protein [Candidatus Angelobacter sp.]
MEAKKRVRIVTSFANAGSGKYSLTMRSVVVRRLWSLLVIVMLAPLASAQLSARRDDDGALAKARDLFRQADFRSAAAAYRKIVDARPSDEGYAGLIQSLVKADDVKAADETSQKGLAALPDSALVHASRGDVYFRRGLIQQAEDEYQAALKIDEKSARAWLGRGRVDAAYSRRGKAKAAVAKAHELDPEDSDAFYEWAIRLPYPENVAALERHLAEFHNGPEEERHEREFTEFLKALAGRKTWVQPHEVDRAEIKLEALTAGSRMMRRGYGLRVRLNDRATVTLLLDTGSSGVTITRKLAEKIGARKLSEQGLEGVGKSGPAIGYKAWVDKVVIGDLEFHDCFVHATPREIAEVDGTIGTDVFWKYLITLDLPAHKLLLEPAPAERDGGPPAGEEGYTQMFAFGHLLLAPTEVGKKATGLFVIDSGANANTILPELARLMPEMRAFNSPMSGASGVVNSAFISDDATLRFANVNRRGERISTVDLHSVSKNLGVEISGQIGFAALEKMKVTIDYRYGLVQVVGK